MDIREWEGKYYSEFDKNDRKELLDERIATGESTQELELTKKLFDIRYTPQKKEPADVDHMLRAMMQLKFINSNNSGFFKRFPKKEVESVYRDLGKETAESYGEAGRRIWYRELNHLGKTFLSINQGDRGYTSYIWGMGQLKDSQIKVKLAKDIYLIAYEVPQELNITKELEVFTAAVTAAYNETFPKDTKILGNMIRDGE